MKSILNILEFQEIHDRRHAAYGYMVSVNGTEVYFRTYRELGAGPSYFFVEVPLAHQGVQALGMVQRVVCGSGASDHTACRPITVNGMRALAAYEQAKVLSNG